MHVAREAAAGDQRLRVTEAADRFRGRSGPLPLAAPRLAPSPGASRSPEMGPPPASRGNVVCAGGRNGRPGSSLPVALREGCGGVSTGPHNALGSCGPRGGGGDAAAVTSERGAGTPAGGCARGDGAVCPGGRDRAWRAFSGSAAEASAVFRVETTRGGTLSVCRELEHQTV